MELHSRDSVDPELSAIERRLVAERPVLEPLELDRVRIRLRVGQESSKKGTFMKSRIAVVLALTFGVFASGTGVTLGVTALNSTSSAAKAQYGPEDCDDASSGEEVATDDCAGTLAEGNSGNSGDSELQATGQTAAAGSDSLPFTGYAAIPVLMIGLALITGGLMLRHRLGSVRE